MVPALKDAIVFHSTLNPAIWGDDKMLPEVREDLLKIMDDFREFLGIDNLDIVDITVSGSNAAYTYTPHSDIDLHLVVNVPASQDKLYTELFDAKKALYNLTRNIKVRSFDVELYVQDSKNPVESMGIYSVLKDRWISFPRQVKAEINDVSVLARVRIYTRRINEALASDDLELAKRVWRDFRAMRKAGLDKGGEFSPENLAYKILRTREFATKLYDHILALKDKQLSLEHIEESRVDELFNVPVDTNVEIDNESLYRVTAEINGRLIKFGATKVLYRNEWKVAFIESRGGQLSFSLTGSGGELEVMAFVKRCMEHLVNTHHPDAITFDASNNEQSRVSLYLRMVKRYMPAGYHVDTEVGQHDTEFRIVKSEKAVVNELFKAPVDMKIVRDSSHSFTATTMINGREIQFGASTWLSPGEWKVAFLEKVGSKAVFDMTGSGGEIQVMNFVKQCMEVLIAKHSPESISFDANNKDESRVSLYARMLKRYMPDGYHLATMPNGGDTEFTLVRD